MSVKPPQAALIAFLDANPSRYKNKPEPDGYNKTVAIVRELTRQPLIANPVDRKQVPKPMAMSTLYEALSAAEVSAIPSEAFGLMGVAIEQNNRESVKRLVDIALRKTWIDQTKHDAIVAEIDAMIDDPNWESQIPGLSDIQTNWPSRERGIHQIYIDQVLERV